MDQARETQAIWTYLGLVVLFCAIPVLLIAYSGQVGGGAGTYVHALMWGCAAAAIVTTWWRKLDWNALGFAWRDTPTAWMGYYLPIGYAAVAYLLIWTTGLGGFATPETIAPLAARMGWSLTDPATFAPLYFIAIGLANIFPATIYGMGEELGWRGFLTPHLVNRFGFTGGTLVMGVIWTSWHVPIILFSNYNNGAPSAFALACFFVMVMNLSFIMTWLRLKSGSVWPCAILHGSHNLFIQTFFTPLTVAKGSVTAYAIDEFGFMLPLVTFVVALVMWLKRDVAIAAAEARGRM